MKKGLVLFIVAVALVLTGCKKKASDSFNGFSINQGDQLTMIQGQSVRLSMSVEGNASPVYTFASSDENIVSVDESGVVFAMQLTESPVTITVTGSVVVNNQTTTKEQTIQIRVIDLAESLSFTDVYFMLPQYDWQSQEYFVYQIRRNRAEELPDGGDALIKTKRIEGNRDSIRKYFPMYDEWVHLYDTVASDGTPISVGLFMDSVSASRTWILNSDCFFDSEGSFQCAAEQGAIIETFLSYYFDKYAYILGPREFVDDVLELDSIRPEGVEARPFPGVFQIGHFEEDLYLEYMTALFKDEEAEDDDVWHMYDTHISPIHVYNDEEGNTVAYPLTVMGYPTAGYISIGQAVTEGAHLSTDEYKFSAYVFGNSAFYCLNLVEVEDETGETVLTYENPLAMAPVSEIIYEKAASQQALPAKNGRISRADSMRPIRKAALDVQMKVANTVGAIFRMSRMK